MTNEQLAILIAKYAETLSPALAKIDSDANEQGYKELETLLDRMREDIDLLNGRVHHSRVRELERIAGSKRLVR